MKNTAKNLINQVKKALANKSSFSAFERAYADEHGNLLARSLKDNADILVFIGGIVEDMNATNKMYSKDALTLAADTGVFKGGTEVPEHYNDVYAIPDGNFIPVCEISADDLKAAAYTASKDNTRPVLTGINITPDGIIQTCDGFRAYRKKCNPLHHEALTSFEKEHGFILSAAAASYGFKGLINISLSGTHIKLEDTAGLVLYVRKLEGQFINMESIYKMDNKPTNTAKIKAVKELTSVLKTAKAAQSKGGIFIRVREGAIDYFIPALDIYGTIEAETEINTRDTVVLLNPSFLYDAIANQGGTLLEVQDEPYKPAFIRNGANRFELNGDTLVLPIRHDDPAPFEKYDHDRTMEKQRKQWEEIKARHPEEQEAEATPAPAATATDTDQEATTDKKQFFETPAATVRDFSDDEKEALKRINDRQNVAGRFENITAEDVKKEAEKIAAERQEAEKQEEPQEAAAPAEKLEIVKREEITPPEVVKARNFYKQMRACNFKPTAIQEAEAETIYKLNREQLQPIARQAGNLYIDTLSIIAAIMSVYDN